MGISKYMLDQNEIIFVHVVSHPMLVSVEITV